MRVSARRTLRLIHTADVLRIPAGSGPSAREIVAAGVACSAVYPASAEQAERAGMASVARLLVIYTTPIGAEADHRLITDDHEYRVRAVSRWPWNEPVYCELLLEEES